jgi:hypothetical protein
MSGIRKLSGPESLEQSRQHFLYFEKLALGFLVSAGLEHFKIAREQKKILKFAGRPHRNIEELSKLGTTSTAAPFGDVCGDGTGRAPDLAAQTKAFVRRKFAGEFVRLKGQSMTPAPNFQFAEVLHDLTSLSYFHLPSNYLQLTTNDCQLCDEGSCAD